MTLDPRNRGSLKQIMRGLWLNVGQGEELRSYNEPPCDNMDPWVSELMMNLGSERDQILESFICKRSNRVTATHLVLSTTKPKQSAAPSWQGLSTP